MSNDWEVTVITDSNYIKKVRVNDCVTRADAEAAALGMTGGKRVVVSNPKTYYEDRTEERPSFDRDTFSNDSDGSEVLGYLVIGIIIAFFAFWKFFLIIGIISLIIWLIFKFCLSEY